jgi:hypothetical protein
MPHRCGQLIHHKGKHGVGSILVDQQSGRPEEQFRSNKNSQSRDPAEPNGAAAGPAGKRNSLSAVKNAGGLRLGLSTPYEFSIVHLLTTLQTGN